MSKNVELSCIVCGKTFVGTEPQKATEDTL